MNLNCAICSELFLPSHDPYATQCGHIFHNHCLKQWMNISQTCPQCRNKCTERTILRVYFNVANIENSQTDFANLQQKCDTFNVELLEKNKSLYHLGKKVENLEEKIQVLRVSEAKKQKEIDHKKILLLTQQTSTAVMLEENKRLLNIEAEYKKLKNNHDLYYMVQNVISGTVNDVETIVQQNNNINTLAVLIAALKRELKASEQRREDVKNSLKATQKELRKVYDENRDFKDKLSQFESDNYHLKQEVKRLEQDVLLGSYYSTDSDISTMSRAGSSKKVVIPHELASPRVITTASSSPAGSGNISLEAKKITESTSPYLCIKSSNVGLAPILKYNKGLGNKRLYTGGEENRKVDDKTGTNNEFLIFKRPRMNQNLGMRYINMRNDQQVHNLASVNTNGTLQPSPITNNNITKNNTSNNNVKIGNIEKKLEDMSLPEIKAKILAICSVAKRNENFEENSRERMIEMLIKTLTDSLERSKEESNYANKSVSSRIKNGQLKKQTFIPDGKPSSK